jgi:CheY-like chemotaxis protein
MTLLCIDDDAEDLELICEAIRTVNKKYTVMTVQYASDAISLLETLRPDYIFIDINMPGIDGIETLRRIRDNHGLKDTPICMLSTALTADDVKDLTDLGASKCLRKPNTFEELCEAMKFLTEYEARHAAPTR